MQALLVYHYAHRASRGLIRENITTQNRFEAPIPDESFDSFLSALESGKS
jgi:hypothetical protein